MTETTAPMTDAQYFDLLETSRSLTREELAAAEAERTRRIAAGEPTLRRPGQPQPARTVAVWDGTRYALHQAR